MRGGSKLDKPEAGWAHRLTCPSVSGSISGDSTIRISSGSSSMSMKSVKEHVAHQQAEPEEEAYVDHKPERTPNEYQVLSQKEIATISSPQRRRDKEGTKW